MLKRIRVIVCGTNFGRFYINACNKSEEIDIKGILSRGSEESRKVADYFGLPLYTEIDQIPIDDVDVFVIVARSFITGGKSNKIIKKILEMGISVIQEQPVHVKEVIDIGKSINKSRQSYYVNNFYRFMPAVKAFLDYAQKVKRNLKILRIRLSCTSQVLYPLVDILYDLFGGIETFEVKKAIDGNMCVLSGMINSVPFILNYYNEYGDEIDGGLALFFDIKVDTNAGNLILDDPEGTVIWQSHLMYSREGDFSSDDYKNVKPIECLFDGRTGSYSQRYEKEWPIAMEESIRNFFEKTLNSRNAKLQVEKTEEQCKICTTIIEAAGRPNKIDIPYIDAYSLSDDKK